MISVENITKTFGNTVALHGVTFSIGSGEIVGLLGPNGAGKTTTMRILSGFYTPDKGTVIINDFEIVKNTQEAQKHIGYLPENNPLYKDMLVDEILGFSMDLKDIKGKDRKEALDFVVNAVNIGDVYYRPIGELSKGYKQRVGIAIALLHRPSTLIMDEPTEGLDPNQRTEIRSLIKNLAKVHTIIISTHVMQEVEAICSRVILINKGELKTDSSVEELSRSVKNEKTIFVDIEGRDIKQNLNKISGIKKTEDEKSDGARFAAKLTVESSVNIQPKLSELIRENNWTIWKLQEEKLQMEDIFKQLTQ